VFFPLDDDGILNKSREQHWNPLRALFSILTASGLALNQEKCVFAISELDFLVRRISATGVAPLRNIQVILFLHLLGSTICVQVILQYG
jgi:hypothetical protein